MYITFRSQSGIGKVAKNMGFGKDIVLKVLYLDKREGERWPINSKVQLKLEFQKFLKISIVLKV